MHLCLQRMRYCSYRMKGREGHLVPWSLGVSWYQQFMVSTHIFVGKKQRAKIRSNVILLAVFLWTCGLTHHHFTFLSPVNVGNPEFIFLNASTKQKHWLYLCIRLLQWSPTVPFNISDFVWVQAEVKIASPNYKQTCKCPFKTNLKKNN